MNAFTAPALLSILFATASLADDPTGPGIPFGKMGGIQDWRAQDDSTLHVQGRNDEWFRVQLLAPCTGLRSADAIGFVIEPGGAFGRLHSIVVDGRECPLRSVTPSAEPAAQRDRAADSSRSAPAPLAGLGGVRQWRALDADTLQVQGGGGLWVQAELLGVCPGLLVEDSLGFVLEPARSFDRWTSVMVNGQQCPLASLVAIRPPVRLRQAVRAGSEKYFRKY